MKEKHYPRRRLLPGKGLPHVDDRPLSEALAGMLRRLDQQADAILAAMEEDAPADSAEEGTEKAAEPEAGSEREERASDSAEGLDTEAMSW
ncbi:MAG TPA: hypothetical protein PKO09_18260 [Anaerolineae bacterium]|nr:hypothetical protein [Anaerolineae bacterium]